MIRFIIPLFIILSSCGKDYDAFPEKLISISENHEKSDEGSLSFKTFTGKHLNIHFLQTDSNSVKLIEESFNAEYEDICGLFQYHPSQKIEVTIYPTMKMMFDSLNIYGYIAGIVTGNYSMAIVSPLGIDINNKPMNKEGQLKIISHEFVHILIHRINYYTATWLNEGTAYFVASQGSIFKNPENFENLLMAIWQNSVPTMTELEYDYNSFFKVEHSLAFSYLMVEFIASKYGKNNIIELIKNNCDFQKTLGLSKNDFYKLWIDYLRKTYTPADR